MALASLLLPLLPMTTGQILLNNLLSDVPMLALSGDVGESEGRALPHHWSAHRMVRFIFVFGMVSSLFDGFTFSLRSLVFDTVPELFRTGWFVVSLLTELNFLVAMRTERPVWRSHPSPSLPGLTVATVAVAVFLPLPGCAAVLGFQALSLQLMGAVVAIIVGYGVVTELVRLCFLTTPEHGRIDPAGPIMTHSPG